MITLNMQNIITIIIALIIGGLIACHTFCGCSCINKEGFDIGAPLEWNMGNGVPGDTWSNMNTSDNQNMHASLANNHGGPVPPKNMFMWSDNLFLPECCFTPQQYSSSNGCACISTEQMQYISSRGGNNTLP